MTYEPIRPALAEDICERWVECHHLAYLLAKAERRRELEDVWVSRFDGRGLHPWSELWGQIIALWKYVRLVIQVDVDELLFVAPHDLRAAARADAQEEYNKMLATPLLAMTGPAA